MSKFPELLEIGLRRTHDISKKERKKFPGVWAQSVCLKSKIMCDKFHAFYLNSNISLPYQDYLIQVSIYKIIKRPYDAHGQNFYEHL